MSLVKNIFLVDDDADDQEFFIEALSTLENVNLHSVANNGREALNILVKTISLPDIIFLDFNMPAMNGIECLREIIYFPRTKHIPVIMLSSAIEQAELCRKLGAKGFIKKCADIITFRTELQRAINCSITVNYIPTGKAYAPVHFTKNPL